MRTERKLPGDWYDGELPANVVIDETAYVETSFSFYLCRSEAPVAVSIGRGSSTYLGTMFDVGPNGTVTLGDFVLVHGARIICDSEVTVGDHALISWNVVFMDSYRVPLDPALRRRELELAASRTPRRLDAQVGARPVHVGRNTWIGFDCCILPGVTIGEGAIVGARSVVVADVEPYTVVAGNPARLVKRLDPGKANRGD